MKHYPIARKKWNEEIFFLYFFQRFKTHFFVSTKVQFSSPNDVMKFINLETGTTFFSFSLTEITTRVSALLTTCKRNIRTEVSSRVLNSNNFAEGMALPKAGSLSLLYAWFRLHIG